MIPYVMKYIQDFVKVSYSHFQFAAIFHGLGGAMLMSASKFGRYQLQSPTNLSDTHIIILSAQY